MFFRPRLRKCYVTKQSGKTALSLLSPLACGHAMERSTLAGEVAYLLWTTRNWEGKVNINVLQEFVSIEKGYKPQSVGDRMTGKNM